MTHFKPIERDLSFIEAKVIFNTKLILNFYILYGYGGNIMTIDESLYQPLVHGTNSTKS